MSGAGTGAGAAAAGTGRAVVRGRIVTPHRLVDGYVQITGDQITAVTPDPSGAGQQFIVPGFVDLHNHGGGGHTFTTGDPAAARAAAAFHLRHGTTTLLASLVSAPYPLLQAALAAYAPLVAEGVLAGVHLEGPYLSAHRCGAQHPEHLRDASPAELSGLLAAGGGTLRMVTLAPERPGGLAAIELLAEHGVVAAVGHTDATYRQTRAAVAAGATVATHLGNAMRPVHHREPGPVIALLQAPEVVCELIADGVHLHDGMLAFAAGTAGPGRTALITDATAPAGMPDGRYELGGRAVVVAGGVARVATADGTPGSLAGSTLTQDAAFRRATDAGLSLVDAARAAATTPAQVLGLAGTLGSLLPGLRADLVVLDSQLQVSRVMRAGAWVAG